MEHLLDRGPLSGQGSSALGADWLLSVEAEGGAERLMDGRRPGGRGGRWPLKPASFVCLCVSMGVHECVRACVFERVGVDACVHLCTRACGHV